MKLQHARIILIVNELGSISQAAKQLYTTQSALSQMILSIEENLGTKIFDRRTRPISLTFAGIKYIDTVKKMIFLEDNLTREIADINNEERGIIRIGISLFRSSIVLPPVLPLFHMAYPLVTVDIIESGSSKILNLLRNDKVDFAFILSSEGSLSDCYCLHLWDERVLLFTADKELQKLPRVEENSVSIRILDGMDIIALRPGHGVRSVQDELFKQYNVVPNILFQTDSIETARKLAIAFKKSILFPDFLLQSSLIHDNKGCFFPIVEQRHQKYYLCYPKTITLTKYMKHFIDLVSSVSLEWQKNEIINS